MLKALSPMGAQVSSSVGAVEARKADETLWIDAQDPTPEEMEELARRFDWHPLSVEDALRSHQRPKVDDYESYLLVVTYVAQYSDGELSQTELDIFVGKDYVVSSHQGVLPDVEEARRRWETHPHLAKGAAPAYLLYALLDATVDNYFPVVETLAEKVANLEEKLFGETHRNLPLEMVSVRRELLGLSRVIAPERDVIDHLLRSEPLLRHPELIAYFTDIHDHLLRLNESLLLQRDLLANLQETYLSLVSNDLNQVIRVLTSVSIILMSLSLIAGIYGMNFEHMPELGWRHGYFVILGIMGFIMVALALYFRRRGWL